MERTQPLTIKRGRKPVVHDRDHSICGMYHPAVNHAAIVEAFGLNLSAEYDQFGVIFDAAIQNMANALK